jgi:hypothetical protein
MAELSQAQILASGWIAHFYSADRSIRWGRIEHEHTIWLDDKTLLIGRIDADGVTEDGDFFFADWKTISAKKKNRMAEVKAEYRLDPQMLTYGLLTQANGGSRFMVRWAMKTDKYLTTPLFFYEWYSYTPEEIAWWRNMVLNIAAKIRSDAASLKPFITNLTNCLRYGQSYACPFLAPACSKQQWDGRSETMQARESHLAAERDLIASRLVAPFTDVVVLDATRIETWLGCNERYRREYIEGVVESPGQALSDGIEFHKLLHTYYTNLKEAQLNG